MKTLLAKWVEDLANPFPWEEGSKIQSPPPQGEGFRVRAYLIRSVYLIAANQTIN